MASGSGKQQKASAGALVLVSRSGSPGFGEFGKNSHSSCPEPRDCSFFADDPLKSRLITARSAFLVQLTRQYETKKEAVKRRAETRHAASKRYDGPAPKANLRHLVWA